MIEHFYYTGSCSNRQFRWKKWPHLVMVSTSPFKSVSRHTEHTIFEWNETSIWRRKYCFRLWKRSFEFCRYEMCSVQTNTSLYRLFNNVLDTVFICTYTWVCHTAALCIDNVVLVHQCHHFGACVYTIYIQCECKHRTALYSVQFLKK